MTTATITTTVESRSSAVGQVAFWSSATISPKKMRMLRNGFFMGRWQARRDSNPQPTVLETATLPIELLPCGTFF
jgi:hypothetical protein